MLGLIKKDLLMIKSNAKILVILFAVYGFMMSQEEIDLSYVLPFMSVVIMMSTFSYDAFNKWDAYVCSLPDGRKNSVRAKYAATIILILTTTLIVAIISTVISYINTNNIDLESIFSSIFGALFSTTLIQSFMYPAIYKFGIEKARIGIFGAFFGISVVIGITARFVDFETMIEALEVLDNYWMIIFPITMILILFLSYKLSEGIYRKKEY